MEAEDNLVVRLKNKHDPEREEFDVRVLDIAFTGGYSVLIVAGTAENPRVELRTFYYHITKITFNDGSGGVCEEEFDDTLVEQGEAVDIVRDYVRTSKNLLGSQKAGPARIEVGFKYRSQDGKGSIHTGVVIYAVGPAGQFRDHCVSIRNWSADGGLAKTRTSLVAKSVSIVSMAAYTAQSMVPFKAQRFNSDTDEGHEAVVALFLTFTEAEKRIVENWECFGTDRSWSRGAGSAYSAYSTGGYYTHSLPKPARVQRRGDASCVLDWQAMKKSMDEGKVLVSLQAAEESEKKVIPAGSYTVSTPCACNSPRCFECNPDLVYIH
jgi:hypothetical protein